MEHLYELRKRLFWVVLVLVLVSAAGFEYKDQLMAVVMAPLHGQKLIYLTPGGGFSFIFTLSIYFGALFTIPVAIYQLYRFLQPIIGRTSRRFLAAFMIISTLLAAGGALFGYFVTIPAALNFLSNFAGDSIIPSLTADSYLNFVVTYIVGLAALFQLPLVLFIIDHVRPLPPGGLSKTQNYVIIGATVLAAVITPTPDAFNMMIVAFPIITVYEIGALAVFIRRKMRTRRSTSKRHTVGAAAPSPEDEPLTAIIEELQSSSRTKLEPEHEYEPVMIPETPSPAQASVAPVTSIAPPKIHSIDGFSVRTRPPVARVSVPARSTPVRPQAQRPATGRQMRSLDGFLTT